MKTREEKRWELMQEVLFAESRGDKPLRVSSQRTLFGIKSHVETVIDAVAEEDRKKCEELIKSQKNNANAPAPDGEPADGRATASEPTADKAADGHNADAPAPDGEPADERATADEPADAPAPDGEPAADTTADEHISDGPTDVQIADTAADEHNADGQVPADEPAADKSLQANEPENKQVDN